ncbi:hypothetical protein D9M70_596650 [compost metagenome]
MRFGGIDQLFDHPVIQALAFAATKGHPQLFFQRVQGLAFGEQRASGTVQRRADALGRALLFYQALQRMSGEGGRRCFEV